MGGEALLKYNVNELHLPVVILTFLAIFATYGSRRPRGRGVDHESITLKRACMSAVALRLSSFQDRVIYGNHLHTVAADRLAFPGPNCVGRVRMQRKRCIRQKTLVTDVSGHSYRHRIRHTARRVRHTHITFISGLVNLKCSTSVGSIPRRVEGRTRIASNCCATGCRLRDTGATLTRYSLCTPFSNEITGISTQIRRVDRGMYALISSDRFSIRFDILRTRLSRVHGKRAIRIAPFVGSDLRYGNAVHRVGPVISRGNLIGIKTHVGNEGNSLVSNRGVHVIIRGRVRHVFMIPGSTIIRHSKRRIIFLLHSKQTV